MTISGSGHSGRAEIGREGGRGREGTGGENIKEGRLRHVCILKFCDAD